MLETIAASHPWMLVCFLAIICVTLFLLTVIVMGYSSSVRMKTAELQLKRDMVTRGITATDIERVLWVSGVNAPLRDGVPGRETLSDNEYSLIEKMLDDGREMEDIVRVIRALKPQPFAPEGVRGVPAYVEE